MNAITNEARIERAGVPRPTLADRITRAIGDIAAAISRAAWLREYTKAERLYWPAPQDKGKRWNS